jgi:hypothetical protein
MKGDDPVPADARGMCITGFAVWRVILDGKYTKAEVVGCNLREARAQLRPTWPREMPGVPWPGHKRIRLEFIEVQG